MEALRGPMMGSRVPGGARRRVRALEGEVWVYPGTHWAPPRPSLGDPRGLGRGGGGAVLRGAGGPGEGRGGLHGVWGLPRIAWKCRTSPPRDPTTSPRPTGTSPPPRSPGQCPAPRRAMRRRGGWQQQLPAPGAAATVGDSGATAGRARVPAAEPAPPPGRDRAPNPRTGPGGSHRGPSAWRGGVASSVRGVGSMGAGPWRVARRRGRR